MSVLWLDFETRSRCDLKTAGAYNYALDESTEVLCLCYAFDDGDVQVWTPQYLHTGQRLNGLREKVPEDITAHIDEGGQIRAHNAAFDRLILSYVLGIGTELEQWYCTATQARANCMPGALGDVGRFAGLGMKKDHRGAQLIRWLSIPRADGTFNEDPKLMQEMVEYCAQDVRAMRAASKAMRELTAEELYDYHVNERVNDLGVRVDVELCQAAVRYAERERVEIEELVYDITDGEVPNVRSRNMCQWVYDRVGPEARKLMEQEDGKVSIDKSVRANLLALAEEQPDKVPVDPADVIQCADDLWASSVAKFKRFASLADPVDHRVRGAFVFAGGAATGRAACVSATTRVDTEFGPKSIIHIDKGEKVLTHTGRFCKVSEIYYKGRRDMYRVLCHNGATVECTGEHRLLTSKGWVYVKELISNQEPESTSGSYEGIFLASVPYDGRDRKNMRANARYGGRYSTGDHTPGQVTYTEGCELLAVETGGEESYVRGSQTSRGHNARCVSLSLGSGNAGVRSGASTGNDESPWFEGVAGRMGGTPYRFEQNEQLLGQLGDCNKSWASTVALTEIREVVRVGKKGVWDITVEGDASYCAQGLIHHNSFGLQAHNLPRKCSKTPEETRAAIVGGLPLDDVSGTLKSMLRPAMIPAEGHVFVVADWSAIEGRVNPWLSNCEAGEKKLQDYRDRLDPYKVNAAALYGVGYDEVTKDMRQVGKVQELGLGYLGGAGAFDVFAKVYGIRFSPDEVDRAVKAWRRANPWAMRHGRELEAAYLRAMKRPGTEQKAARTVYLFDGTHLWYSLPSGRILCYPFARLEDGSVTYAKASWKPKADAKEWPRGTIWPGLAIENLTQAAANDILRHALRELDDLYYRIPLHVHDEIVLEVPESDVEQAVKDMTAIMTTPPTWAEGLPLDIETSTMERYGK